MHGAHSSKRGFTELLYMVSWHLTWTSSIVVKLFQESQMSFVDLILIRNDNSKSGITYMTSSPSHHSSHHDNKSTIFYLVTEFYGTCIPINNMSLIGPLISLCTIMMKYFEVKDKNGSQCFTVETIENIIVFVEYSMHPCFPWDSQA